MVPVRDSMRQLHIVKLMDLVLSARTETQMCFHGSWPHLYWHSTATSHETWGLFAKLQPKVPGTPASSGRTSSPATSVSMNFVWCVCNKKTTCSCLEIKLRDGCTEHLELRIPNLVQHQLNVSFGDAYPCFTSTIQPCRVSLLGMGIAERQGLLRLSERLELPHAEHWGSGVYQAVNTLPAGQNLYLYYAKKGGGFKLASSFGGFL